LGTDSNVSILQPGISSSDVKVTDARPYGLTVEVLEVMGRQTVSFRLNGREFKHTFLVCSLLTEAAGIIGTDLITQRGAMIDFDCCKLWLNKNGRRVRVHSDTHTGHSALTIFLQRVKSDTALNRVNRRRGKLRNRLKTATTVRQLPRAKRGLSKPKKMSPLHPDAVKW